MRLAAGLREARGHRGLPLPISPYCQRRRGQVRLRTSVEAVAHSLLSPLQTTYQSLHSACFSGRHAPFSFELATHCVMKFIPSTPSATFGYRLLAPSNFCLLARAIMSA